MSNNKCSLLSHPLKLCIRNGPVETSRGGGAIRETLHSCDTTMHFEPGLLPCYSAPLGASLTFSETLYDLCFIQIWAFLCTVTAMNCPKLKITHRAQHGRAKPVVKPFKKATADAPRPLQPSRRRSDGRYCSFSPLSVSSIDAPEKKCHRMRAGSFSRLVKTQ